MTKLALPTNSAPGLTPQQDDGRLINVYVAKRPGGDELEWLAVAGLSRAADLVSHSHCRGMFDADGTLLDVRDNRIYSAVLSGSTFLTTDLGALAGTLPVTIAQNNASPKNIVAVTENGAFNLSTSGAPTSFADPDLLANPTSVSQLDGYFIFTYGNGVIQAGALNSLSVDALSVEPTNQPLKRGVVHGAEFFAFSETRCRVYHNVGSSPFPLQYVTTIPVGIVGTHAIAGWEKGWGSKLIWVASDNKVYLKPEQSYQPQRISDHPQERMIEALGTNRANLVASVYMQGGHEIWALSCDDWTWEYNTVTGAWNERHSYGLNRWRVSATCFAFNRWMAGENEGSLLFYIDNSKYAEDLLPISTRIDSRNLRDFPNQAVIAQLKARFISGVGNAAGAQPEKVPRVSISWSKDGGQYWSTPVQREIGRQGRIVNATVNGLGQMQPAGFKARLEYSSKTIYGLEEVSIAAEPRS